MHGYMGHPDVTDLVSLNRLIDSLLLQFQAGAAYRLMERGEFTRKHYEALLRSIFHQTRNAPLSFALAGANCDPRHGPIKDYLLLHALEEKDHWQWARSDLEALGADISSIDGAPAPTAVAAFMAFNFYVAHRLPFARMGTALFLETMSARLGPSAAAAIASQAGLTKEQMVFFLGHAESDQGHSADLAEVLSLSGLSAAEFGAIGWAAATSAALYRNMYDDAVGAGNGAATMQ